MDQVKKCDFYGLKSARFLSKEFQEKKKHEIVETFPKVHVLTPYVISDGTIEFYMKFYTSMIFSLLKLTCVGSYWVIESKLWKVRESVDRDK